MAKIKLTLTDWLYNAGIIGFVSILEHAQNEVRYEGQDVYFDEAVFKDFEEKYFNYFIDTYEKTLSWYKIVSFESFIQKHIEEEFVNFDEKALEVLNSYIGTASKSGSLKYLMTSNSYKAAYSLIESEINILQLEKQISQIKLKKNDSLSSQMDEIKIILKKIDQIITYCKSSQGKKYLAAKNVVYTIIKNAWNGVSFLNSQTKIRDMYNDYREHFIKNISDYITLDKSKLKYNCSVCNLKIKDLSNDLSFMNMTGFDTSRKPSHVWNFINDTTVCPVCKLVYSCVPAGFTYVFGNGIFINLNQDVKNAKNVNAKVKYEILNTNDTKNVFNVFKVIINEFDATLNESVKYELSDIQVVRLEDEKYRFNLLSKNLLSVMHKSKELLNQLIKKSFKEVNTYFNLYEETMKKIINNENLFLLIHKVMIRRLTKSSDCYFHMGDVLTLIKINNNYLEGVVKLDKINREKDVLELAKNYGYYLQKSYADKGSENKINGISYRLLNALKTNNIHMFMDTLINCYLYTKNSVPKVFVDAMKDEFQFKSVGYAFVAGMTNEDYHKTKENGGGN